MKRKLVGKVWLLYQEGKNDTLAKTSKALSKAIQRDRAKNPDRTAYTSLRRGAFNFARPKPGTKSNDYINSDYAKEDGRYINDLKDLLRYTAQALKSEGFSVDELKHLL